MSKEVMLQNIHQALKNRENQHFEPKYQDIMQREKSDPLEEYLRLQKANMADVIVSSQEKLLEDIQKVLKESGAKKLLYTLDLPCDASQLTDIDLMAYDVEVEKRRETMFDDTDTSLLMVQCGVSNLGIMGLISSQKSPRLASLITEHCIMLLDSKNIVANIYEGVEFLKKINKEVLPTNIFFVAGPSRTADIELKTVFGVHGPRKVTVIVY